MRIPGGPRQGSGDAGRGLVTFSRGNNNSGMAQAGSNPTDGPAAAAGRGAVDNSSISYQEVLQRFRGGVQVRCASHCVQAAWLIIATVRQGLQQAAWSCMAWCTHVQLLCQLPGLVNAIEGPLDRSCRGTSACAPILHCQMFDTDTAALIFLLLDVCRLHHQQSSRPSQARPTAPSCSTALVLQDQLTSTVKVGFWLAQSLHVIPLPGAFSSGEFTVPSLLLSTLDAAGGASLVSCAGLVAWSVLS
jgi:hypothetical protein